MPYQVNGYKIKTEEDVWRLPKLTTRAKMNLVEILRKQGVFVEDGVKKETKNEALELTFAEQTSGKSVAEIQKDRKSKLAAEWKRRKREALLHGYGEQK